MTVELAKPFQWPEAPEDLEPWNHDLWKRREEQIDKRNDEQVEQQKFNIPLKSAEPKSKERKELASLAQKMLSGQVKWTNDVVLDPKWDRLLATEVKTKAAESAHERS